MTYTEIIDNVDRYLQQFGFESYGFKIGWYDELVEEKYRFNYDKDTLAILVLSTPDMFEKSLIPYLQRIPRSVDPVNNSVAEHFRKITQDYPNLDVEMIQDFEMQNGLPKVLVQTAGHVAGATFYYQQFNVEPDPWQGKKMYGVSIHPRYGGWFLFRGVLIFKSILCPDMEKKQPVDCVPTMELRQELLQRFNSTKNFRDIIPVEKRYSEKQQRYFKTPLNDRPGLLESNERFAFVLFLSFTLFFLKH